LTILIRKLDTGSIPAGGYVDIVHAEPVDVKLKKIQIVEATGASVNNVVMTLYVGDVPIVLPDVSAAVFVGPYEQLLELNVEIKAGVKITMRVTNNETAARRLYIHLIYEK
jgi:hypothetical protein